MNITVVVIAAVVIVCVVGIITFIKKKSQYFHIKTNKPSRKEEIRL